MKWISTVKCIMRAYVTNDVGSYMRAKIASELRIRIFITVIKNWIYLALGVATYLFRLRIFVKVKQPVGLRRNYTLNFMTAKDTTIKFYDEEEP